MRKLDIAFDLDDTLVPNHFRYNRARLKGALVMVEELGNNCPNPRELLELNDRIDRELIARFGFSSTRFVESWAVTYEHVCEERGVEPAAEVTKRLRRAAARCRSGPFRAVDGAIEVLRQLQSRGHRLHLVTVGDARHQRRKIRESGLGQFFGDSVHIIGHDSEVDHPKVGPLREIAGRYTRSAVMVGDSKRTDMLPALEIGMHAVLVENGAGWEYHDVDLDKKKVRRIGSIGELPALIAKIAKNGGQRKKAKRRKKAAKLRPNEA